ncbi:nucleotidyltransferase family protein [Aurantimonas sp. C2-6-R+9]|uniref:nucleotidyltransferase family protein n=1 Tax=Aurantimonas sp. C2-6-R+9 TaxID=3114365 RepID=UPI002E188B20|nr:nucleotidyltransferase family protein [Aurantimonas sp. C2-6-R+9]
MSERPLEPTARIVDVVRAIEASRRRIAVVVDDDGRLLGTLTDGDVRRRLLAGGSLESDSASAMNSTPVTALVGSPDSLILDKLRAANVLALPLVDEAGRYMRCVHVSELQGGGEVPAGSAAGFACAVIMAGGEGRRLRPLTESIPKPMVEIGGLPLLERQVRRLADAGVRRIFLSISYLGHIIQAHFGDGSTFGVSVSYLEETSPMGTGGSLALLPERPAGPLLVMNGDILTTVDFGSLLHFHEEQGALVTVGAIEHRVEIPFGVLEAKGAYVSALQEKPSQRFLCNAGVYAVAPEALAYTCGTRLYNMTDLIRDCIADGRRIALFPFHEYWTDIGTPAELERARAVFAEAMISE